MSWMSLLRPGAKDPRHMGTPDARRDMALLADLVFVFFLTAMVPGASRLGRRLG